MIPASVTGMPHWTQQVRWRILVLLFFVTVLNFVDRLTLSYVAPVLKDEFHLTNTDYGFIVAMFMAGMMLGEYPMGWLMDRKGAKFGFSFAVIWWSLANSLHVVAGSKWSFGILRFWMGSGECGNYSGGVKVIGQWFPAKERALAMGVMNGAGLVGNIITPPLVVLLITHFSWHTAFLIPSALGVVWVYFWIRYYRPPAEHKSLGEAELAYIRSDNEPETEEVGNRTLLKFRQAWAVMICRLLAGPVIQFYLFWLPEYLFRTRGMNIKAIGFFAVLPPIFGDIGSVGGGAIAGWLIARGMTVTNSRKCVMFGGALLCALSVVVVSVESPLIWGSAICLVYLGHYALSANMFASISDLFPNSSVARVTALTGIAGGFSGWIFPLLTGWLIDKVSFYPVFLIAAFLPLAGVASLFLIAGDLKRVDGTVRPAPVS